MVIGTFCINSGYDDPIFVYNNVCVGGRGIYPKYKHLDQQLACKFICLFRYQNGRETSRANPPRANRTRSRFELNQACQPIENNSK